MTSAAMDFAVFLNISAPPVNAVPARARFNFNESVFKIQDRFMNLTERNRKAVTVQAGCSEDQESGANIIFIEKRWSCPASLRSQQAAYAISRSDQQCFSHEDGWFAAGNVI
jgi:hypothetical protein